MANFTPKKIDLSKINGGNRYENGSGVKPNTFNDPIEASAYAQALATNQPLFTQKEGGKPSIYIQEKEDDGTPYLVFENLRGKDGEVSLSQLEQSQKVQDDKIALIENQANKNLNQIKGIYSGLIQKEIFANAEDVKISQETQTTGGSEVDGLTIVDNSYATVKKISGDTVAISTNDIRNFKISGVKSVGRNLIEYPYRDWQNKPIVFPKTVNGITFTENNGVITAKGTCTQETWFSLTRQIKVNSGETLSISGCPIGGAQGKYKFQVNFWDESNNRYGSITDIGDGATGIVTNKGYMVVYIAIYAGVTVDNVQFKPMLSRTETALPYEPYIESVMILPQAVELRKWDYIKDGKLYKQSYTIKFDTVDLINLFSYTENYSPNGAFSFDFNYSLGRNYPKPYYDNAVNLAVSNIYETYPVIEIYRGKNGLGVSGQYIRISKGDFTTLDEFKAYLTELNNQGNPLTIVYKTEQVLEETDFAFDNQYLVWDKGQETILSPNDSDGLNSFDYGANPTIENDYYVLVGAEG